MQWMGEAVDRLTGHVAPAVRGDGGMMHLDGGRRILFFLYLFVAVFLLLLPFVLGAFVYARIVTLEFAKIQDVREAAKREFDRKRNLMLSDIAHDLRTPITTVSGYAKALSDGMVTDPERRQEYLDAIQNKSYKKAKEELLKLFGVGVKVADCICLFALHHLQAFPVDTHIHQAMEAHYKRGFPKRRYKGVEGVLQQYIFYYELAGTPLEAGKRSKQ